MSRLFSVSVSLSLLFQSINAFAWPPTFGAEFNFTNTKVMNDGESHVVDSDAAVEAQNQMKAVIEKKCAQRKCTITALSNSYDVTVYRVTYEDGWWFQIATDPKVVEVQTKASTVDELKAHRQIIQEDIFDASAQVGLRPANEFFGRTWAGGHFHVGIKSSVGSNTLFFRNLLVDFVNHPELSAGIFANDVYNAPTISSLPDRNRHRFVTLINELDQKIAHHKKPSIAEVASELNKTVYFSTPGGWEPPQKYQAFNVTRVGNDEFEMTEQTFEIRGSRPQSSADQYIAQVELTEQRLRLLRFQKKPIVLKLLDLSQFPEAQRLTAFYDYVAETGLDFKNYEQFLSASQLSSLKTAIANRPLTAPTVTACEFALGK